MKYKEIKKTKFAINKAGTKLIQSLNKVILTVTTLTYAAIEATTSKVKALMPKGSPSITSLINPDINIHP